MKKKTLDPADLRRLAEDRPHEPRARPMTDALVACAVVELLGPAYAYLRYARLNDFVDGCEPALRDAVVSLCVFAADGSTWSPVAVVECAAPGDRGDVGRAMEPLGIAHVVVTAQQIAAGYARTPRFRDALQRAVAGSPSTPSYTEEFQSERKPIYPPRRGVTGH